MCRSVFAPVMRMCACSRTDTFVHIDCFIHIDAVNVRDRFRLPPAAFRRCFSRTHQNLRGTCLMTGLDTCVISESNSTLSFLKLGARPNLNCWAGREQFQTHSPAERLLPTLIMSSRLRQPSRGGSEEAEDEASCGRHGGACTVSVSRSLLLCHRPLGEIASRDCLGHMDRGA